MAPPTRAAGQTDSSHPSSASDRAGRTDPTDPTDKGSPEDMSPVAGRHLADRTLLLIVAAVTVPLAWMGYGTDIDVANVLDTADGIRSGSYYPSRTPGAPVFEALVAALDPIGGHLAVNLSAAVAAAAAVVGIARLVRAWGHANGDLLALAFLASPITIIAATSLADFLYALALLIWGALAHLGHWRLPGRAGQLPEAVLAGVMFALAIGVRASTTFLVVAFVVADGWDREHRRRCLQTLCVAAPLALALFVPSWLAFDRSLDFLENEEGFRGLASNLGLFLYKGYIFAGLALLLVLVPAIPALLRSVQRWGHDPMVRFALLVALISAGLFFQMPWKLAHLLPCLLAAMLWLGASSRGGRRRYLWLVVAAVALNGLVTFRPLAPDTASDATTGTWEPALTAGPLLNDIDCRAEAMSEPPTQDNVEDAWTCALRPVRGLLADGEPGAG